jgi:hypothetical protein
MHAIKFQYELINDDSSSASYRYLVNNSQTVISMDIAKNKNNYQQGRKFHKCLEEPES